MDPYDSPLRSPRVVPITHSPIPYLEPGSLRPELSAKVVINYKNKTLGLWIPM